MRSSSSNYFPLDESCLGVRENGKPKGTSFMAGYEERWPQSIWKHLVILTYHWCGLDIAQELMSNKKVVCGVCCMFQVSSWTLNMWSQDTSNTAYWSTVKLSLLTSFLGLTFGTGLGMSMYTWSEHVGSPCCAGGWPHVSVSPWALAAHSNYLWPGSACRRDTTTR